MRVLMVASECYPLVKTGGLADVVGALPGALAEAGTETRVLLPNYPGVAQRAALGEAVAAFDHLFGGPARVLRAQADGAPELLVLDAPHLFDRPGNPYLGPDGLDWPDNHLRFAALARAAATCAAGGPDGWMPDLLHGHDWQAGLAAVYLASALPEPLVRPPVVFTVHNIAFPGLFPAETVPELGLPPSQFTPAGFEYYGQLSFMKAGLVFSDALTTVSPTYARELRTPRFGMGFEGVLEQRQADLIGILNGINEETWNPVADAALSARYSVDDLSGKAADRAALQAELGLDQDPTAFLLCVVSRLTDQKGLDLLADALPTLLGTGGQLALLGTGMPELEAAFQHEAETLPRRVAVRIGYDEALSHRMIAGADAIIVPSRFEPCGLTQMYGLRYGTVPIVARTGGLADSVVDANEAAVHAGVATGIVFDPNDPDGLRAALLRARMLFADRTAWRGLMLAGMRHKVGWARSAQRYRSLYDRLLATRSGRAPGA
jgi:starch synthase